MIDVFAEQFVMPDVFKAMAEAVRHCNRLQRRRLNFPRPILNPPGLPSADPERMVEAVRRALPQLLKLGRYERRATARRERALRGVARLTQSSVVGR